MIRRSFICEVGEAATVRFYIETESLAFDYDARMRSVRIALIAESDTAGVLTVGDTSQLSVFGRYFALPSRLSITIGEKTVISHTLFGVDGEEYQSSAPLALTLGYTSAQFGEISGSYSVSAELAKMYLRPEVGVSVERIELGKDIALTGEMLSDEAYALTVFAVLPSGERLSVKDISASSPFIPTRESWISSFPSKTEFDLTLLVEGSCLGKALPEATELKVSCYLGEGAGLPTATVTERFPSDNEAIAALGFAVRNRSRLSVAVTDIVGCYGAQVTECRILFGGDYYYSESLESGILTEAGSYGYAVRLTDSRGRVAVINRGFTVADYGAPYFKATVQRVDGAGEESKGGAYLRLSAGSVKEYALGGVNSYRFYYKYKESGAQLDSEEREFDPLGEVIDLGLEPTVPYTVTVICRDAFDSTVFCVYQLDCLRVELNIAKNKIGVGKIAETDYLLDCAWDIRTAGDVTFTDGSGNPISMRDVISGGSAQDTVRFEISNVRTQSVLDALLTPTENGVRLVIMFVVSHYLSVSYGWHFFITYKNDQASGYTELSTVQ